VGTSIGTFKAKAQLSQLLQAVEASERFSITMRGKPVADPLPHRADGALGTRAS
jgi:antitoxin (DNA-binding transcriptional repressor) of toxin-antitoxin stability system